MEKCSTEEIPNIYIYGSTFLKINPPLLRQYSNKASEYIKIYEQNKLMNSLIWKQPIITIFLRKEKKIFSCNNLTNFMNRTAVTSQSIVCCWV